MDRDHRPREEGTTGTSVPRRPDVDRPFGLTSSSPPIKKRRVTVWSAMYVPTGPIN